MHFCCHKKSFTLLEVILSCAMLAIISGVLVLLYLGAFKAFNATMDRSKARGPLAQALALLSSELRHADGITECSENAITFTADIGEEDETYRYYLYHPDDPGPAYLSYSESSYQLVLGSAGDDYEKKFVKARDLDPPTDDEPWFACADGAVTIDISATRSGESVRMATRVRAKNIPRGIIGWWKFEEESGTTALDSSSNGHAGTITSATYSSGALEFAGAGYVTVPDDDALDITGALTLAARINPTVAAQEQVIISKGLLSEENRQYSLELGPGPKLTFRYNGDQNVTHEDPAAIANETWARVAVTVDIYGTVTFYVNGISIGTASGAAISTTGAGALTIGAGEGGTNLFFTGSIDDVRVYDRALSASEIAAIP